MTKSNAISSIVKNYEEIKKEIPDYVTLVAATKSRTVEAIEEAIDAGIEVIGENYVQEAVRKYEVIGARVEWHLIGHLQKNKINKVLPIFDVIQTVDSIKKAKQIDQRVKQAGKEEVTVYIEINIGREKSKHGAEPKYESLKRLACSIADLEHLKLEGLMTMAPFFDDPEKTRPYFRRTKELFDRLNSDLPNIDLKVLSMGMSNSYKVAIEEGSNMVRIGSKLFGQRSNSLHSNRN